MVFLLWFDKLSYYWGGRFLVIDRFRRPFHCG